MTVFADLSRPYLVRAVKAPRRRSLRFERQGAERRRAEIIPRGLYDYGGSGSCDEVSVLNQRVEDFMTCNQMFRQKVANLFATAIILLLFQPARASAAGFPFLCRGQMPVVQSAQDGYSINLNTGVETVTYKITIQFQVNPTGAGKAGENLYAGTCAWVDRPTNTAEGRIIVFTFKYATYPPNIQMLTQCSVTPDCVFQVDADNPEGSPLTGSTNVIRTLFPEKLGAKIIPDARRP
jgi:hypothetical protein